MAFLQQWGNYLFKRLSVYIYDLTFIFVQGFWSKGDRSVDQMVQAARSG